MTFSLAGCFAVSLSYHSNSKTSIGHLKNNLSFIHLNLSLIFISTSGVLGRYITIDSTIATWWRCAIAGVVVLLFCKFNKISISFENKENRNLTLIAGVLMAIHWVTYFYSLDYSNVAIGVLTLYTFPAFTAVLEPLMTDEKYEFSNILLAIISLIGVAIINPDFDFKSDYTLAIVLGLISAMAYAVRNILMRKPAKAHHGSMLMLYQIIVVGVLISPGWFILDSTGWQDQWLGLGLLAIVTTAIGHSLFVMSLKSFSATSVSLLSCIIPVYALLWAYLFLNEIPTMKTLIGGVIILSTVAVKTIIDSRKKKNKTS